LARQRRAASASPARACSAIEENIAASREQILNELLNGTGVWSIRVRTLTAPSMETTKSSFKAMNAGGFHS